MINAFAATITLLLLNNIRWGGSVKIFNTDSFSHNRASNKKYHIIKRLILVYPPSYGGKLIPE